MSNLTVNVPDYVRRQAEVLAEREQMSLDELVSIALATHVSAWQAKDHMEERGRRGSWRKFKAVLEKAPDMVPPDYDRL